ncbi:MAG: DinB family protein [Calditrichaeota bacterium]|nr:MAG: DinB family protein [Calditrichota bacterium]
MKRPAQNEYAAFYHTYISTVPDGDICETLANQLKATQQLLSNLGESKADSRYAPQKWSLKEVLAHVVDTERVFAFRALCFARNDAGPFPSMEQDDFVRFGNFSDRTLQSFLDEFTHLRRSNILLFESFDDTVSRRVGTASGTKMSVRAIAYIIAGHERHHMKIIREKYL